MSTTVFTVTHPDGSTSKRTSKTRNYTWAIVCESATPEARAAAYERAAVEQEHRARRFAEAAEAGRTRLRDRRLNFRGEGPNDNYFHSHEIDLLGTEQAYSSRGRQGTYCEVNARANHLGQVEGWEDSLPPELEVIRYSEPESEEKAKYHKPRPVVDGAAYVIAKGKVYAESALDAAKALREEGAKPEPHGYVVLRWSSRRDLAQKALTEFEYEVTRHGRRLHVVPVNAQEK